MNNIKKILVFLCAFTIIFFLVYKIYTNNYLSYNDLKSYVNRLGKKNNWSNIQVKLEKDIGDTHLLFVTYNIYSSNLMGYIEFRKFSNNKYKYIKFGADTFTNPNSLSMNTNLGKENEKHYSVIYGTILNNQPNRFIITCDGKSLEYSFDRNKFFAKEFEMESTFSYRTKESK